MAWDECLRSGFLYSCVNMGPRSALAPYTLCLNGAWQWLLFVEGTGVSGAERPSSWKGHKSIPASPDDAALWMMPFSRIPCISNHWIPRTPHAWADDHFQHSGKGSWMKTVNFCHIHYYWRFLTSSSSFDNMLSWDIVPPGSRNKQW